MNINMPSKKLKNKSFKYWGELNDISSLHQQKYEAYLKIR